MKKKKNIVKKILMYFLSVTLVFSNVNTVVYAGPGLIAFLMSMGYAFAGGVAGTLGSELVNSWLGSGKNYYDSSTSSPMNYYNNNSNFGNYTSSGANNEHCYNSYSSTVNDNRTFSLIKDSYNSTTNNYNTLLYNPVTNNYVTTNNISYNVDYDTYYIENNDYDFYVTNNYTYVSYYIIDNNTSEETYVELYYEMPDGRNSYDLKPSEVWGEYFIYEVVGYDSVMEDDGKTLALYHLDGDGKDSSARQNADMTLGVGVFQTGKFGQGLLVESSVSFPLPSEFDSNNFTLEFVAVASNGLYSPSFHIGDICFSGHDISASVCYFVFQVRDGVPTVYLNGANIPDSDVDSDFVSFSDGIVFFDKNLSCRPYFSPNGTHLYDTECDAFYVLDEVRLSNCPLYEGDSISVPGQAFDTNQVLLLPTTDLSENLIAVQAKVPITSYRVGGVRPTYPVKGDVFICLENDVVVDIQQFEGDAWYSVGGAIYRNGDWNDLKKYDLSSLTVKENEITDSDGSDDSSDSDDSGGSDDSDGSDSGGGGLTSFLEGLGAVGDAILSILGKLMEYVGKAIELFSGVIVKIITLIPQGFTQFIAALFPFIPTEWIAAIELSLVLSVILSIIKAVRG